MKKNNIVTPCLRRDGTAILVIRNRPTDKPVSSVPIAYFDLDGTEHQAKIAKPMLKQGARFIQTGSQTKSKQTTWRTSKLLLKASTHSA